VAETIASWVQSQTKPGWYFPVDQKGRVIGRPAQRNQQEHRVAEAAPVPMPAPKPKPAPAASQETADEVVTLLRALTSEVRALRAAVAQLQQQPAAARRKGGKQEVALPPPTPAGAEEPDTTPAGEWPRQP
jgi:hypothetical protein